MGEDCTPLALPGLNGQGPPIRPRPVRRIRRLARGGGFAGQLPLFDDGQAGMKRCRSCGRTLPANEFNRNRTKTDGRTSRCKDCDRAAAAEWLRRHPPLRIVPTITEKTCAHCRRLLPRAAFSLDGRSRDGLQLWCKECNRERNRETYRRSYDRDPEAWLARNRRWKEANPEQHAYVMRRSKLKKYDMTPEEYEALLAVQGGVCGKCKKPPWKRRNLSVDHDHRTDQVRGLLHTDCNTAIGLCGDDVEGVQEALDYLLSPPASRLACSQP